MRNTKTAINTRHAVKFNIYQLAKIAMFLKPSTMQLTSIVPRSTVKALFPNIPPSELFVECFYDIIHATPRVTDGCKPICLRVATEKNGFQQTPLWYNWHNREVIDTNEYNEIVERENKFFQCVFGSTDWVEYSLSVDKIKEKLKEESVLIHNIKQWTGCLSGRSNPTPTYKDVVFISLFEMDKYLSKLERI